MRDYVNSLTKLEFDKILLHLQRLAATEIGNTATLRLKPLTSLTEIRSVLRSVTEFRDLINSTAIPPFDGIVDCRPSIKKAMVQDTVLSAPELRAIGNIVIGSRNLKKYVSEKKEIAPNLYEIVKGIVIDVLLETHINNSIDQNHNILDTASRKLKDIRTNVRKYHRELSSRLESILLRYKKEDWVQDEIITLRDGRMVIPVKMEHKNHVPGFIHSTSLSGLTAFVEPAETLELNNEILTLQLEELREINSILRYLTMEVRTKCTELIGNVSAVESLDVLYAKARYSLELRGTEISVGENDGLRLESARHPLLIEQKGYEGVTPLDLSLTKPDGTLVISGPNAGGKSIALKTVGILAVMAHAGMHTPSSQDSHLPFFERLFVDIGDEQSIENNLSTFTSHLEKIKTICDQLSSDSLVLIDEICSGTDPNEGGALATAILLEFSRKNCICIVSTHNSIIKAFALNADGIQSGSMEFDIESLKPTYLLRIGSPGSSYGLEIAERLGISRDILRRAREVLGNDRNNFSDLILKLEYERKKLEDEREALRQKRIQAETLAREFAVKSDALRKEEGAIKFAAMGEARSIIDESKRLSDDMVRAAREHPDDSRKVSAAKTAALEFESKLDKIDALSAKTPNEENFVVGDRVQLKDGDAVGEVIEVEGETITVLSKLARIKIKKRDVSHVNIERYAGDIKLIPEREIERSRDLDVRGMRVDEAIAALDKHIDNAIVSGLTEIRIIHGKGTGVLRKHIALYLEKHSQVVSARAGEWNEGGMGITVIQLR